MPLTGPVSTQEWSENPCCSPVKWPSFLYLTVWVIWGLLQGFWNVIFFRFPSRNRQIYILFWWLIAVTEITHYCTFFKTRMDLSCPLLKLKWILVRLGNPVMAIVTDMAGIHKHLSLAGIHPFFSGMLDNLFK